jgi:hypothetical protein
VALFGPQNVTFDPCLTAIFGVLQMRSAGSQINTRSTQSRGLTDAAMTSLTLSVLAAQGVRVRITRV